MTQEYDINRLFAEMVKPSDEIAVHFLLSELHKRELPALSKRHVTYMARETVVFVARAVSDGTIVGFGRLVGYPGYYGLAYQAGDLVVHPEHRRRGIATEIVEQLLETARQMEISHLDLMSNDDRPGAQHIYKEAGFVDRGLTRGFSIDLPVRARSIIDY